ncbi:MAG TPA: EAL domain-containing protein [Acidimicrobiia bacterium]|nr:EAL domain-containing protein [Acidimicrobiia bacterium]
MGKDQEHTTLGHSLFCAARAVTHPAITIPLIFIYGVWLFLRSDDANNVNIGFSAMIEFTKGGFAFIAIFGSLRLARKERIVGWILLSIACVFWTIGEFVYGFGIISERNPDLHGWSIAHTSFLIAIPLAIVGVFMVGMHGLRKVERLRIALDSLAITCVLVFLCLAFLAHIMNSNRQLLPSNSSLQFSFFVLDITFASLALSMMLYRRLDKMIVPIAIGMVLQASADMMWISDQFRDTNGTRPFARLLLLCAAALYCFAATRTNGRPTKFSTALSDRQLRLGVFALVFGAIIFAILKLPGTETISPLVALSFVSLFMVTLVGQIISHYENTRLSHEQGKSLEAISESEARFRIAFENGPTGLLLVDSYGSIVKANFAIAAMLAQSPADLVGTELIWLIHPDDREMHMRMANSIFGRTTRVEYDARFIEKEGSVSWGSVSVSEMPTSEGTSYVVYQIEDISERKTSEERLQYLAVHDPLTGLANRTYLIERSDEALRLAKAQHETLSVLFIDLDRFKVINDSLGHSVGDQVIQTIAHRIRRVVGERGTVARFGGDEFVVLIAPPTTESATHMIAQEILDAVIKPFPLEDGETYISCSIGVLLTDGETHDPQSLLRDADSAMYRAKELGRNRIETADRQVHQRVMRELKTVNELHHAVANNEMRVFYQPIIRLDTGEVSGFEALVRWQHPTRGLISPDDFIPLAEDTGLILDIGKMVTQTAFNQLAQWQEIYCQSDGFPLTMSVNLAVRQLSDPHLLDLLEDVRSSTATAPDSMILEITESVLLGDTRHAITILNDIHSMGYRLRVDDFGTGYASLTYLKRFPIDGFKIDKSFIAGLGTDENDTAIVHALIGLAHSMHLTVVAEGVETKEARDALKELGCVHGQGYLYSRPEPPEQFTLESNKKYIMAKLAAEKDKKSTDNSSEDSDVINLESRRNA